MIVSEVLSLASFGLYPVRLHYPIFREIDGRSSVLCSCGNLNCRSQGKHPVSSQWGRSASQDAEIIEDQWKSDGPEWNVGIILGICHGIPADRAIIDIEDDSLEGRSLADSLLRDYPGPAYTSGKSIHRLYRWSTGLPDVANMTINGLEFRFGGKGKETQSVAPPSMHNSGRRYEWLPGRSLDDMPLIELPQHILEYLTEEYTRQSSSSSNGHSATGARMFRSPRGKVSPGSRHHSLLSECNRLWRLAYQIWGVNGLEEQDVIDQVWMWIAGANLLVCDPPQTEAEVDQIFRSSQRFMQAEILREIDEEAKRLSEMTDPPASAAKGEFDGEVEGGDSGSESAPDDSFGGWLGHHGIRLQRDRRLRSDEDSPNRIDEWVSDWRMSYLTKGDEELIAVHFNGIDKPSLMRHEEFNRSALFARRVQQDTKGRMSLMRTFTLWDWQSIWEGRRNDRKGAKGITRGLREWLLNKADVVEHHEQDLSDQVEEIILAIAGNQSDIEQGLQEWRESGIGGEPEGRLKISDSGALCAIRLPEDPATGWYLVDGILTLCVKMDEVNRRYRSSYGSGVANRLIAEAMASKKLGFEKKKFSHGKLAGRWHLRQVEQNK